MAVIKMKLPAKAIKEFKDLYIKFYGIRLTDNQAQDIAGKFLRLFQLLSE